LGLIGVWIAMTVDLVQHGWSVERHHQLPRHIRQAVQTMMTLRLVDHQPMSILAEIPNELMFLVFEMLPITTATTTSSG
jgi:hypothetical protein